MTQDYGMKFEEVVIKFLGKPNTSIYYASIFGDNFKTKALLFSICLNEINYKDHSDTTIKKLKEFEKKISMNDSINSVVTDCIDYLKNL